MAASRRGKACVERDVCYQSCGGHVLDFTLDAGHIAISTASDLHLRLPTSGAFLHADLVGDDVSAQIHHAEGGD